MILIVPAAAVVRAGTIPWRGVESISTYSPGRGLGNLWEVTLVTDPNVRNRPIATCGYPKCILSPISKEFLHPLKHIPARNFIAETRLWQGVIVPRFEKMCSMIALTDDELIEVTRKKRPSAQVRALRLMGIAHRIRPDGSVLVLRESLLDEQPTTTVKGPKINWN